MKSTLSGYSLARDRSTSGKLLTDTGCDTASILTELPAPFFPVIAKASKLMGLICACRTFMSLFQLRMNCVNIGNDESKCSRDPAESDNAKASGCRLASALECRAQGLAWTFMYMPRQGPNPAKQPLAPLFGWLQLVRRNSFLLLFRAN
jgi:hypothetical protein